MFFVIFQVYNLYIFLILINNKFWTLNNYLTIIVIKYYTIIVVVEKLANK